jgi:hypothetical protein
MLTNEVTKISIFHGKQIRRIFVEKEWWFSVIDVSAFLTDSKKPRDYWHKMKIREKSTSDIELSTICRQLKLTAADGKKYETDCANTEGIFRIIQSIPSQLTQQRNSQGLPKLRNDAKDGGAVAGRTRKDIEQQLGDTVISKESFLPSKKS